MKKISTALIAMSSVLYAGAQSYQLPVVINPGNGATSGAGSSLKNVVLAFKDISAGVYSSLFVVALILFFFGIFKLLLSKDSATKPEAYKYLGFGVLALFVMAGIWGLVAFLSSNLGIGVGGEIPIPRIPTTIQQY